MPRLISTSPKETKERDRARNMGKMPMVPRASRPCRLIFHVLKRNQTARSHAEHGQDAHVTSDVPLTRAAVQIAQLYLSTWLRAEHGQDAHVTGACDTSLAFTVVMRGHRAKPQLILKRRDKRTDHRTFDTRIANRKSIHLIQPKIVTTLVRVATQIIKVL
jgi:hypothetical protein